MEHADDWNHRLCHEPGLARIFGEILGENTTMLRLAGDLSFTREAVLMSLERST